MASRLAETWLLRSAPTVTVWPLIKMIERRKTPSSRAKAWRRSRSVLCGSRAVAGSASSVRRRSKMLSAPAPKAIIRSMICESSSISTTCRTGPLPRSSSTLRAATELEVTKALQASRRASSVGAASALIMDRSMIPSWTCIVRSGISPRTPRSVRKATEASVRALTRSLSALTTSSCSAIRGSMERLNAACVRARL